MGKDRIRNISRENQSNIISMDEGKKSLKLTLTLIETKKVMNLLIIMKLNRIQLIRTFLKNIQLRETFC